MDGAAGQPGPELTKEEKLNAALIDAASAGDDEAVRRCLRDGVDPNAADEDGDTACCGMRR